MSSSHLDLMDRLISSQLKEFDRPYGDNILASSSPKGRLVTSTPFASDSEDVDIENISVDRKFDPTIKTKEPHLSSLVYDSNAATKPSTQGKGSLAGSVALNSDGVSNSHNSFESELDDSNSLCNQLTPPEIEILKFSDIPAGDNWNWKVRENSDSDIAEITRLISNTSSVMEDSLGDDLISRCSSQPSLIKNLKVLKIKSNHGRP